jgi:hypothetical protein
MKRTVMAVALALLVAPTALLAQGGGGRMGGQGMGMGMMNVAKVLIENRSEVTLSDDQVVMLQVVADSLEKRNAPFMEEMQAMRGAGGMQNRSEADRTKMRATMQAVRANGEAAQKEIDAILSAEQKEKATALLERLRPRRGGGGR